MQGAKFPLKSIVSKLILLNCIILIAFGGVILVNFSLSHQIKNLVIAYIDHGVSQSIANERLSRELNQLSTDLQLLISTIAIEPNRLNEETDRLTGSMAAIILSAEGNTALRAPLDRFASAFDSLLAECRKVDRFIIRIGKSREELNAMFDRIETTLVAEGTAVKRKSKNNEIGSLEQSDALLPGMRNALLKIELSLTESERAHLKLQKPAIDYEKRIVEMLSEMASSISAMTTTGHRLPPLGQEALQAVAHLKEQVLALHESMRALQSHLTTLDHYRTMVMRHISDKGGEIANATRRMREQVMNNILAYDRIVGALSVLVIVVMIAAALYAIRIARPIQRLTRSVVAIASGDLDEEIRIEGRDEVAILSLNFKQMKESIREKIRDLAEQNAAMAREMKLREETEAALRRSEKKYRTLLENIPQKIFYKDTRSIYQSCNTNFSRDADLKPEQIVGKSDFELFPRDLAEKYVADDKRILQSGKTEEIEEPYIYDGQTYIVNTVKTPVVDRDGVTIGILGVFWDITEKKRIEEELRKYEQITAASKDLLAIVGPDYIYQAVNDAYTATFGIDKKNIVGRRMAEISSEEVFTEVIRPRFERCMRGETVSFQEWFDYPASGRRYMDILFSPFFGEKGQVTGVVINARDATMTKQLEDKLVQAQKMEAIGTLAGGIAHDFNNILGAIIGYAELLQMEGTVNSEQKQCLQQILIGADRARNLVNQILAFSRQSEQEIRPIKLEPIVEETVTMMRASIPTTIEIKKMVSKTSGSLMADPTQIHQVLVNLCTNAAHAMKDSGGTLTIRMDDIETSPALLAAYPNLESGQYFRIVVVDTGHGITKENLSRIFEPYFTTKEKGVGTGLGLATVHGIIESFNGIVDVASEPGKGTSFTILLPKIYMAGVTDQPIQERPPVMGKGRILLVDDEKALLKVGQSMLGRIGYDVETADSAIAAMDLFSDAPQRFDIVITDQTMPRMTGSEMARQMLAIRPDIPIILCTGFSEQVSEESVKEMGIRCFLKKPITISDLSEALQKCTTARLSPGDDSNGIRK